MSARKGDKMKIPLNSLCLVFAISLLAGCSTTANSKLEQYETAKKIADQQLATFDTLDFDVFTNQEWDRLRESHANDITVHWPDGHQTKGIEKHIEDLKAMFVYAPDTRIQVHPIKIASGEWTSVVGIMEGTFTKPMPGPDGKTIAPTGKLIWMVTGVWRFWPGYGQMAMAGLVAIHF